MAFSLYTSEQTRQKRANLLPYFHSLLVIVAEEVVGLVGSDGLSPVHAQVKHCNGSTVSISSSPQHGEAM